MRKSFLSGLLMLSVTYTMACTTVDLIAKDGTVIAGRTMEWSYDLKWQFAYTPKNTPIKLAAPSSLNLPTKTLKSKYAFIGINSALIPDGGMIFDGQNNQGLGLSANFLGEFTKYQTVNKTDKDYVASTVFPSFILANYKSVAELRKDIQRYKVWLPEYKSLPTMPTVQYLISDKTGASLVFAFINGEMKFYENNNGILTNAPTYDWHMLNMRNYINLTNKGVMQKSVANNTNVTQLGQGTGSLGLPGDYQPAARFIRMAFLKYGASQPNTGTEAVNLMVHMLNNVDLPSGVISVAVPNRPVEYDTTQYVTIKDLSHNQMYFADYDNRQNFVKIDLSQIFKSDKAFNVPINQIHYPDMDVTNQFVK